MKRSSIPSDVKKKILTDLGRANRAFQKHYPGDRPERQPVHTVYGGADLFRADSAEKMGRVALETMRSYAPDPNTFGKALELNSSLWLRIYDKVIEKLTREPVEDFRIDFEDGFGNRSDQEEDDVAAQAAEEVAKGMAKKSLPPFIGIRIKSFTEDLKERGLRTLEIFICTLLDKTRGKLPENFVVMLPKVTIPEQVAALTRCFQALESINSLKPGTLKCEMMVETTQAVMDLQGANPLSKFVAASKGRMIASAFGTYDYTASNKITAKYQDMGHPVNDFAHFMMKVALGGTGLWLADGATNVMPIGPHRGEKLTSQQVSENTQVVHRSWKKAYDHTRHSLFKGLYQGWDLHPAQFPSRYAAVYSFFLESYDDARLRLSTFVDKSARATLTGDVFDDAATGQGLLNFFLTGMNCGALTDEEVLATGLTLNEIRTRSFLKILQGRRRSRN